MRLYMLVNHSVRADHFATEQTALAPNTVDRNDNLATKAVS